MSNIHRSMQGKMVDMDKLMRQNELMPAIGNVRVNARGDELGPGGKIIKKREDVIAEYYDSNAAPKADLPQPIQPVEPRKPEARPTMETAAPARKGKTSDES